MQKLLSHMRAACQQYEMIKDGDRIAVGVSGGKDSLALLFALKQYSLFSKEKFSVVGITIDNHQDSDFSKIEEWAKKYDIEYHIVRSDINEIVFNERKEKNPCSLCSKLRRGMLNTKALELKCNKLALGHTYEDIVSGIEWAIYSRQVLARFYERIEKIETIIKVNQYNKAKWSADLRYRNDYIEEFRKEAKKSGALKK